MIRRLGGRDRRLVHADRLQRYDEVTQDGVVLASQPEPDHTYVTRRPKPGGSNLTRPQRIDRGSVRVSAKSQPVTMEAEETPSVIGRPQRLRVEPVRFRDCRQLGRKSSSDEAAPDKLLYPCSKCTKEFRSRRGRSRHCVIVHECRIARDVTFDHQRRYFVFERFVNSRDNRDVLFLTTRQPT